MPTGQVIEHLRRAAITGLTDGQLLSRYVEHGDQVAFETLVRRLGPLVLAVCRRILHDEHDSADAFQTTFLVLVRKAASLRSLELVAHWLYGTAVNTALKARAVRARLRQREKQVRQMPEPPAAQPQVWADLDEEVSRLPEIYRVPLVMCDLQGRTRQSMAKILGVPDGTLSSRLARGRKMLARRLGRHTPAVLVVALPQGSVPAALVSSTVKVVNQHAGGKLVLMAGGGVKIMLLAKYRMAAAVVLVAASLACCGVGLVTHSGSASAENVPVLSAQPKPLTDEEKLNALIDRVIKAHGGEERLRGLKVFSMRWRERPEGDTDPEGRETRLFVQLPERVRVEQELVGRNGRAKLIVVFAATEAGTNGAMT